MNSVSPQTANMTSQPRKVNFLVIGIVVAGGLLLGFTVAMWQVKTALPLQSVSVPLETPAISSLPQAGEEDVSAEALSNVGTSTELNDIERDLNATDLTGIDAELGLIEQEL